MPTGERINDGFKTKITIAGSPNIALWITETTPFGYEGGGKIENTTMENTRFRTARPKKLITVTPAVLVCQYDPACLTEIIALIQSNVLLTCTFETGQKHEVWGWLEAFKPNKCGEGEKPTANITLEASNLNDSDVETAPAHVAAA